MWLCWCLPMFTHSSLMFCTEQHPPGDWVDQQWDQLHQNQVRKWRITLAIIWRNGMLPWKLHVYSELWCHDMEMLSVLLVAHCEGNPTVRYEFPSQRISGVDLNGPCKISGFDTNCPIFTNENKKIGVVNSMINEEYNSKCCLNSS